MAEEESRYYDRLGPVMGIERWGWYSILVNVVLAALHGVIAIASGSLAVTAEVVHNLVDLLGAVAVLAGIRLAGRKSPRFPYGLYKIESVVALGMAGLVFLTAYEIVQQALLASANKVQADVWMVPMLVMTTALPLIFSRYELHAGRVAHSPALIADAKEYHIHAFTTGLAMIALAASWLELPIDRIAALLIVIVVLKTGWELLRDAMRVLLDASLDAATQAQLQQLIASYPLVTEVKWITGRNAGRYLFIEAGITLRSTTLEKVEDAVQHIEAMVREAMPRIVRVLVHVEPASVAHVRYALPLAAADGALSKHFAEAPYFLLLTLQREGHHLVERRVVVNPFNSFERGKGIRVAEWLIAQKVDVVLTREELQGKGPAYVFSDAGVELRFTEEEKPEIAAGLS
ncbi:MAG TPA: cation diffusion facilitator family transporter [Gammaproteobacteria bacterium]